MEQATPRVGLTTQKRSRNQILLPVPRFVCLLGTKWLFPSPTAIGASGGRSPPPAPVPFWEGNGRFDPPKHKTAGPGTQIWFREQHKVIQGADHNIIATGGNRPQDNRPRLIFDYATASKTAPGNGHFGFDHWVGAKTWKTKSGQTSGRIKL